MNYSTSSMSIDKSAKKMIDLTPKRDEKVITHVPAGVDTKAMIKESILKDQILDILDGSNRKNSPRKKGLHRKHSRSVIPPGMEIKFDFK